MVNELKITAHTQITINNITKSFKEHCKDFNQNYKAAYARINYYNWSIKQTLGLLPPPNYKAVIDKIYENVICDIKNRKIWEHI